MFSPIPKSTLYSTVERLLFDESYTEGLSPDSDSTDGSQAEPTTTSSPRSSESDSDISVEPYHYQDPSET